MKKKIQTIDCTPTWTGILPILIYFLQDKKNVKNQSYAKDELKRMANAADNYNKLVNKKAKRHGKTKKTS